MSVRPLSPVLAEKARVELNEDPKRINDDLQHIKEWLTKQTHLRARTDDQWLLAFLRGCKFSLERTKEKLDLYYTCRTTAPEFFSVKRDSKLFKEVVDSGCFLILPKLLKPDDPITIIMRPGRYNPDTHKITDVMAVSYLFNTIMLADNDSFVVNGIRSILDLEGVTMGHFLQMTPMIMKKSIVVSQDATPMRMKGVHYLNTPPGFETIFNAMKALLNEKNKNRLFVHNKNYEALYEHIPKEVLPAEYGGNGGTEAEIIDYWRAKVQEYASWLDEEDTFGTDESKRPGKPNTPESMFGCEGSFRQLQFD